MVHGCLGLAAASEYLGAEWFRPNARMRMRMGCSTCWRMVGEGES